MRTILRNGLDRYEVLKADEPLRRGERLVRFASERGALEFLIGVGGPARRDLHRLADDDFAGEFSGVRGDEVPAEIARRVARGELKIAHVEMLPVRFRRSGREFIVLERRDRLRRGESWVGVLPDNVAVRLADMLMEMPGDARRRLPHVFSTSLESEIAQSRRLARLLLNGDIRIAQIRTLVHAGGAAPPPTPDLSQWEDLVPTAAIADDTPARAAKQGAEGTSGSDKKVAAAVASKPAPDLVLPQALVDGLDQAWKDSFPDGRSQEQGGILVRTFLGKYVWKRAPPGDSGSIRLNLGDRKFGEKLIATVHTHPYDATEGGHTDVSFSGQDLARLVGSKEKVTVVRSGDTTFAIGVTKEFKKLTRSRTAEQQAAKMDEIKQVYNQAYKGATGTFQEKIDTAVKTVAKEYKLLYYKGKGSTLKPVPL